jgi:hypothetical protein
MALQKDVTVMTEVGEEVTISNSYIKVAYVYGDKNVMKADVAFFKNADDERPYDIKKYRFKPNLSSNFIKQSYNYLKTLEEFSGSTDV